MPAESIEKKITNKTKAILIVHLTGNPSDMDPIMDLAKKYGLWLLKIVHRHTMLITKADFLELLEISDVLASMTLNIFLQVMAVW